MQRLCRWLRTISDMPGIVRIGKKMYRDRMKHLNFKMVLVGVVLATAACSSPPYVHNSGEFNRSSEGFGQPVKDISQVTVCYNSSSATPRQVTQLAVAECARFNKTATFTRQDYNICPLASPVAAIYNCQGGK